MELTEIYKCMECENVLLVDEVALGYCRKCHQEYVDHTKYKLEVPTEENSIYYVSEEEQEVIEHHQYMIAHFTAEINHCQKMVEHHYKQVQKIMEGQR